jgi:hypothetical protein
MPRAATRTEKKPGQVDANDAVPFLQRDVERGLAHRDAGVVDQDIDGTDLPERGLHLIFIGNIAADIRIQIDAGNFRARFLQQIGGRLADAACGAGDDGRFALQVEKIHRAGSIEDQVPGERPEWPRPLARLRQTTRHGSRCSCTRR